MIRNWEDKFFADIYNVDGKRTNRNIENWQFNCGGYALETY